MIDFGLWIDFIPSFYSIIQSPVNFGARKMTLALFHAQKIPFFVHNISYIEFLLGHIIWRIAMGFWIKVYRHERLIIIADKIEQEARKKRMDESIPLKCGESQKSKIAKKVIET